ncbi:phosphonate metabolism protein/1,5-bisphosphokinase (PRPP-forming) PhnN [Pseudomonas plecoglossicida]|jgi:ribose 1,5-bisphosphokinase|uniref:phosphonate metabolism protein/1,5-bisphosphokinase (PRPP-forming) PhnN n=1 Tax=Pseudomonas TaxID=286 RepID=UPI000534B3F4|nr:MULTISPECIES: phosphonate metabolism protein/1,5-bisphosphokinase (PRPP-forming) PhnN [Pseudomonas]ANI35685.1 ribose-phosphate pyrophosphokinase [Pseudomonas sp. JY-Q]EKT4506059.1 phosphonate metabolism protein/1,5-bisphosphokinase (PRPP-forming) PhnN [Pseudomonas putida]EKT4565197.1 phosphonate metabolism protein/1,5-bisphosphokinase (PRPP-forming) PhnN [Pseudomonas putida]ELS0924666.1 phosphonate metabolism protein/1,5-bisphosphokinase (PRPP-forming) PhnN [Pseudomonas putida]MCE0902820.1 
MQHDASDRRSGTGRLIFLVGPSGSGKDSLIDASREQLALAGVEIARRVITRSAEAKGEAAQGVTPEQFDTLRAQGAFAMHWRANGLDYGIPRQVDQWLAAGRAVLVNGSRAYLPEARQRYPDLLAVLVEVKPEVLRQRLLARGRETAEEVEQRLARSARLQAAADPSVHVLDNSSTLEAAVAAFVSLLRYQGVLPRG